MEENSQVVTATAATRGIDELDAEGTVLIVLPRGVIKLAKARPR